MLLFVLFALLVIHPEATARVLVARGCLIVTVPSGQKIKLQQSSSHSIRVRAVPNGSSAFRDDLVSALVADEASVCDEHDLAATDAPASLINGNLKADVLSDSRIRFTRISDGKVLIQEIVPRRFGKSSAPFDDFFSLDASFQSAQATGEIERIYGQFFVVAVIVTL